MGGGIVIRGSTLSRGAVARWSVILSRGIVVRWSVIARGSIVIVSRRSGISRRLLCGCGGSSWRSVVFPAVGTCCCWRCIIACPCTAVVVHLWRRCCSSCSSRGILTVINRSGSNSAVVGSSCGSSGVVGSSCGGYRIIASSCGSYRIIISSCGSYRVIISSCGSSGVISSW